jgi:hypothetical protein
MSAVPSLDSAYALIKRAEEHINDLKGLYNELIAAQAKATVIKSVLEKPVLPGEFAHVFDVDNTPLPVPDDVRILIGEASNSLRSALNYLVGRLCERDSGTKQIGFQFPIEDDPNRFKGNRPRFLPGMSDGHVAAIERLQPYNGCKWTPLLAKISNIHKHDDLVLVRLQTLANFSIAPTEGKPGEFTMNMQLEPAFRIALGDGLPIIETLEVIQAGVAQTLDAFKPEFE